MSGPVQTKGMVYFSLALLLGAALLFAYSPALGAGYVYDDHRLIVHNPFLEGPLDWGGLFFDKRAVAADAEPDIYRPLSTLSFHVEHRLGKGSALFHHAAGLGFHLLNSLLLFHFLLGLLRLAGSRSSACWAAFCGAALFALHPVQVESVVWISSRSGQISAFFVLLALLAVVRAARTDRSGAGFLLFVGTATFLACLARESGVMTGLFVLSCALCLRPLRRRAIVTSGVTALGAALLYVLLRLHVLDGVMHQIAPHGGGWFKNFLYGAYGCFYQVCLIFRPTFHNLDFQDGFFDALSLREVAAGALAYLFLVLVALLSIRRRPLAAVGVLFVVAAQFPTSSLVITVRSLVNDRYLYLPLIGVSIVLGSALVKVSGGPVLARRAVRVLLTGLLLALSVFTFDRSRDWTDSKSLWTEALKTHPASIRAHVALSKVYRLEGDAEGALKTAVAGYTIARRGTAVRMNAMYQAVQALRALGRDAERENLLGELLAEAAHPERSEDFRLFERASLELCELEVQKGRFADAARVLEALIGLKGATPERLYRLGIVLEHAGLVEEAEEALLRGTAMDGDLAEIHFRLADLYERTGRHEAARDERRRGEEKDRKKKESSQLER